MKCPYVFIPAQEGSRSDSIETKMLTDFVFLPSKIEQFTLILFDWLSNSPKNSSSAMFDYQKNRTTIGPI